MTHADRAAVLLQNTFWERDRSDEEERVSPPRSIVEKVFRDGEPVISDDRSAICLPMQAFENRNGVVSVFVRPPRLVLSVFSNIDLAQIVGGDRRLDWRRIHFSPRTGRSL